jgi:hypothetical protein
MVFQNIMMGAGGQSTGYDIDQSIRFTMGDSAFLTRTPDSSSNRRTWTFSFWWKVNTFASSTSGGYRILQAGSTEFGWSDSDDKMYLIDGSIIRATTQVFRDPTAWQHIVLAVDTTDSTAGDRVKIYINGSQVTSFSTSNDPSENFTFDVNDNVAHNIGKEGSNYIDAYIAEIYLIDGTQAAPTAFGEFDDNGVWKPIEYSGSFGTNGFYIDGRDSSDLGDDESGNGNDFTSSGLAAADQVNDSPTVNYPTISRVDFQTGSNVTLTDGNLNFANANSGSANDARATVALTSGKWYWEVEADSLGQSGVNREFIGVVKTKFDLTEGSAGNSFGATSGGFCFATTGQKISSGSAASYGSAFTAGDYIGVALDLDNGKMYFSINGTFQNSGDPAGGTGFAFSGMTTDYDEIGDYGALSPAIAVDYGTGTSRLIANFGQSAFQNDPPSGFKAINSANLPAPSIVDGTAHFNATTYTGNGSSGHSITNDANSGNFQPDLWLVGPRSNGDHHTIIDVARGVTQRLKANENEAEATDGTALITFESNGFDLDTTDPNYNGSSRTYVAWQWKTQGGAGSSNTDGSINTTTTSVNSTAKFSISTYTGTGSNATIGHGLGTAPQVIWIKRRDDAADWACYNMNLDSTSKYLVLNTTAAEGSSSAYWNTTEPTSSVFSIGTDNAVNASGGTYVAYAFAAVTGYSLFSEYTGTGDADGPFALCGFKPACIIIKRDNGTNDWVIIDNQRVGLNPDNNDLDINNKDSEGTNDYVDILANGFKIRSTDSNVNSDGGQYTYMAFAEMPFGGSGTAPATAR